MKKLCFTLGVVLLGINLLFAQDSKNQDDEKYNIHIKKSTTAIKLDGMLDEDSWKAAEVAKNFFLNRCVIQHPVGPCSSVSFQIDCAVLS